MPQSDGRQPAQRFAGDRGRVGELAQGGRDSSGRGPVAGIGVSHALEQPDPARLQVIGDRGWLIICACGGGLDVLGGVRGAPGKCGEQDQGKCVNIASRGEPVGTSDVFGAAVTRGRGGRQGRNSGGVVATGSGVEVG